MGNNYQHQLKNDEVNQQATISQELIFKWKNRTSHWNRSWDN